MNIFNWQPAASLTFQFIIRTDLNFSHFFCELGLKMLGPQQWQLLHVEKDMTR
jgi:hypothetical protein